MIIPAQTLQSKPPLYPLQERYKFGSFTGGLGPAGYDISIAETIWLWPGRFLLASALEKFDVPNDMLGVVHDKSSWARRGVFVQNTVIEPGWRGFLTLEITSHRWNVFRIDAGTPIAQVIFHRLEAPTLEPYEGRYQDQPAGPQRAAR